MKLVASYLTLLRRNQSRKLLISIEGIKRESGLNDQGQFEDELFYGILRRDWLELYDKTRIEVVQ
jgi:hypothetical protein